MKILGLLMDLTGGVENLELIFDRKLLFSTNFLTILLAIVENLKVSI